MPTIFFCEFESVCFYSHKSYYCSSISQFLNNSSLLFYVSPFFTITVYFPFCSTRINMILHRTLDGKIERVCLCSYEALKYKYVHRTVGYWPPVYILPTPSISLVSWFSSCFSIKMELFNTRNTFDFLKLDFFAFFPAQLQFLVNNTILDKKSI